MADITEEIKNPNEMPKSEAALTTPEKKADAPTQATAVTPSKEAAPEMSKGEKLYNFVTYNLLNYWTVLGLSLYFMDHFSTGKGRPTYDKALTGITKALKNANVDKAIGEKAMMRAADVGVGVFSINLGGNALLLPLWALENRKRPAVHWLNKNLFHEKQLAPDGHEERPDEIYIEKEQPHQGLLKVIGRRLLAMGSTIVTGIALDAAFNKKFDKPTMVNGKMVTEIGGQDRLTDMVKGGMDKIMHASKIPALKKLAGNPTFKRYLGYAALDAFFTLETATVMRKTNGEKKARMPNEIGDDFDPPAISDTNEIVLLPDKKTPVAATRPTAQETGAPTDDKLEKYKKKSITTTEKFTDRAKPIGSPSLGM